MDDDSSAKSITDVLHDAEIIAVSVNRFDSIGRVDLRLENGTFHTVELHGLKAFRCEDLVLQNVVNRVLQSVEMQISSADCEHWIKWVTSVSDASSWLDEKRKKTWLIDLAVGKINLIVFEPSAGATLTMICERAVLL
jgi:hypothetical protein